MIAGVSSPIEVPDRTGADAFHAAALKSGGRDNGKSGPA